MSENQSWGMEFAQLNGTMRDMLRVLHRIEEADADEMQDAIIRIKRTKIKRTYIIHLFHMLHKRGMVDREEEDELDTTYTLSEKGRRAMREYGGIWKNLEDM